MKDFHPCDDFFCTVVTAFVVAFCMHGASCTQLPAFQNWLSKNNWRALILGLSDKHIDPFKPSDLRAKVRSEVENEVAAAVAAERFDWETKKARDRAVGITTTRLRRRNWEKEETDKVKTTFAQRRDVIYENALILLNTGLLYLDFADACRGGYSARVEKCIQCFAVLFQGSYAKNYAGEMLHLAACLKKLWNPEFK